MKSLKSLQIFLTGISLMIAVIFIVLPFLSEAQQKIPVPSSAHSSNSSITSPPNINLLLEPPMTKQQFTLKKATTSKPIIPLWQQSEIIIDLDGSQEAIKSDNILLCYVLNLGGGGEVRMRQIPYGKNFEIISPNKIRFMLKNDGLLGKGNIKIFLSKGWLDRGAERVSNFTDIQLEFSK